MFVGESGIGEHGLLFYLGNVSAIDRTSGGW